VFDPSVEEARDGYDAVEWFAKQPWCNGKVAMFGGSYAGQDQWLTAMLKPPHLSTIAPVASARPAVDFPMYQNMVGSYILQWLTLTSGKALYAQAFNDNTLWQNTFKRLYLDKAAFSTLDAYSGNTTTVFHKWLQHPDFDAFWKATGGTKEQIAGIGIPVLEITGANDGDQVGALSYHADLSLARAGSGAADFLVIGPWDHPGTRQPKQDFGGEHYGPASLVDVLRLHREWYDYILKGGPKPAFLQKPVAYYISGAKAECWKYADSLQTISSKSLTLFPDASNGARSVYQSGVLAPSQTRSSGGEWISDPNDLSAADPVDGAQPGAALHGDGLVFHSAVFKEDTEIVGMMDLRLWLSIDAPDTDLQASLYLIAPDGKARSLTETMLRARYRNSLEHPEAIHESQPEEYRFAPGTWFGMRAPKGAQLRLVLGSVNDPSMEKNWNSMRPVAEQTGADARVAHIRMLQDAEHPSTLTIPLGDAKDACKASAEW
jgi:putative CocE/NonD family hydrolase